VDPFQTHYNIIVMVVKYLVFIRLILPDDHLFGLVVRVPGYRSRGPGSIPKWIWRKVHSAS
jgi:hypothetical protein